MQEDSLAGMKIRPASGVGVEGGGMACENAELRGERGAFAGKEQRLENIVYSSLKGRIRLTLLEEDLAVCCPGYHEKGALNILDVGGGSGHLAVRCAGRGHRVTLLDSSEEMLLQARQRSLTEGVGHLVELCRHDFLSSDCSFTNGFDLVMLHGSAEWMSDVEAAIVKACRCVRPAGMLSLLIFNTDRLTLKHGINGQLYKNRTRLSGLTPPNGLAPAQVESILSGEGGKVELLSGIRVFYGFFRQGVDASALTEDEWLEQERRWTRKEPFCRLGEHTHVLWRASGAR